MLATGIDVIGAGPAGSAAAIAACTQGVPVHIFEKSLAPRHKVCGEFIPFEACTTLAALGVWSGFLGLQPAPIRRCMLRWGAHTKQWNLDEPGYSLSRLELDRLLLDKARQLGATLTRGKYVPAAPVAGNTRVLACGRHAAASRGRRMFGFKAHFEGPVDDSVELHFTPYGYFGVSAIEGGLTNVCGIAPEDVLARYGFDIDTFAASQPALADRLRPLSRRMAWLRVGPLVFSPIGASPSPQQNIYPAGDALSFIDPFTGSGIWNALLTGRQAGIAAARQSPVDVYLHRCRVLLNRPFAVSSIFRLLLRARLGSLAMLLPGQWLYRMTRAPQMSLPDV